MKQNSVPGHIYNVDVETTNADIPYADAFFVSTHYCLVKVNDGECLLTVLCDIQYKKSLWGVVKSFIEKNCWAGIQEHYSALSDGKSSVTLNFRLLEFKIIANHFFRCCVAGSSTAIGLLKALLCSAGSRNREAVRGGGREERGGGQAGQAEAGDPRPAEPAQNLGQRGERGGAQYRRRTLLTRHKQNTQIFRRGCGKEVQLATRSDTVPNPPRPSRLPLHTQPLPHPQDLGTGVQDVDEAPELEPEGVAIRSAQQRVGLAPLIGAPRGKR